MTKLTQKAKTLSLYYYDSCPYCAMTRRAIQELGLAIELRNIQLQSEHHTDLIQGGGKPQVPCLRVEQQGNSQWLYESFDIIEYLTKHQNQLATEPLTA